MATFERLLLPLVFWTATLSANGTFAGAAEAPRPVPEYLATVPSHHPPQTLVRQIYLDMLEDWQKIRPAHEEKNIFTQSVAAKLAGASGHYGVSALQLDMFSAGSDVFVEKMPDIRVDLRMAKRAFIRAENVNNTPGQDPTVIWYTLVVENQQWRIANMHWSWHEASLLKLLEEPLEVPPHIEQILLDTKSDSVTFGDRGRNVFRGLKGRWAVVGDDKLQCRKPEGTMEFGLDTARGVGEIVIDRPRKAKTGKVVFKVGRVTIDGKSNIVLEGGKEHLTLKIGADAESFTVRDASENLVVSQDYHRCDRWDADWRNGDYYAPVDSPDKAAQAWQQANEEKASKAQDQIQNNAQSVIRFSQQVLFRAGSGWASPFRDCNDLEREGLRLATGRGVNEMQELAFRNAARFCAGYANSACEDDVAGDQNLEKACTQLRSLLTGR